ncbi:unnamed protein product [Bursaphelenchus okinawaensis]|uniref:Transcription factor CBF/NF-Y/archaeal histone domain-containing protein n=1 Tax=Bursaphelenchus okinawaensis TaxID=465554 RepID=A0A811JWT2_9BILA|nr:unnamed protein product [Bursaphelenchus okinawaensis]CAG9086146.1 unnamed protein product [Bursaphelenchus okinawaensis]
MVPTDTYAHDERIQNFWKDRMERVKAITKEEYRELTKKGELPLARIKKIMKIDEQVKSLMISGEGPIMVAKACEFFIEELTLRAWIHAEQTRRKTLNKSDISNATTQSEMFDFLVDLVPRMGRQPNAPLKPRATTSEANGFSNSGRSAPEEEVQLVIPPQALQGGQIVNGEGQSPMEYFVCQPGVDMSGLMQVSMNGQVFDVMPTGDPTPIQLVQTPATSTSSNS